MPQPVALPLLWGAYSPPDPESSDVWEKPGPWYLTDETRELGVDSILKEINELVTRCVGVGFSKLDQGGRETTIKE